MTSVRATSVVPNKGKESAESEGEVRALQSRRRVGAGRFLEPLAHLRRRYHTFRQMRVERARGDIWALFGDELQITVTRFYFLRACPFLNWSANQRQPTPGL
jgi:hypothetical protein